MKKNPKCTAQVVIGNDKNGNKIMGPVEVEVLTAHFNSGKMRVRYSHPNMGKKVVMEIDIDPFLKKFKF